MKIIGYGLTTKGEADRYMERTMQEFSRLCDEVIILCNNASDKEKKLITKYGFKYVEDNRTWGVLQWKIKQDFLENNVSKLVKNRDMLVCLDMDEVFCSHLTKQWIENAELDAYHVFVAELWNDELHYKAESSFWNVRIWRWNGETKWKPKPLHCGLAPEWTYHYHRFAPFVLKHYGLMKKEDRMNKIKRYDKYDPTAQHLEKRYYDMLQSDKATVFDETKVCTKIEKEVKDYRQTKPVGKFVKEKMRYAYVKNPFDVVLDIPERSLEETLKRKGFSFVAWADDIQKDMEDLFEEVSLK